MSPLITAGLSKNACSNDLYRH